MSHENFNPMVVDVKKNIAENNVQEVIFKFFWSLINVFF